MSIILPTYNRAHLLPRAVKSIIAQTFSDFEIIIIDDGSSDNTREIVHKLIKNNPTFKIEYLKHANNKGGQAARNSGIRKAKGDWIAFLDSDDEWLPNRLSRCLETANKDRVKVVHADGYIHVGDERPLKKRKVNKFKGYCYSKLLTSSGPMFPTLLVSKECFKKIGYLDECIVAHQEWDTSIRLAKYYKFGFVDEPLFIWHQEGHRTISSKSRLNCLGYEQIINKFKKDIINLLGNNNLIAHYDKLAYRYYDIRDYKNADRNFKIAATLSTNKLFKVLKRLQNLVLIFKINPKYIDLLKIYNFIKRRLNNV